ncbi:hypothetical protein [Rhodoferax sp. GW822-FHT02A01]|uniref:hypothetical protein n=1 Tax=Rhodoferax sp. GW822-FHT02A01 TaxID=3141537 RepID=UPI00315D1623
MTTESFQRTKKDTVVASRRGDVVLVSVRDKRIAPHYPETSGGISGDIDGPNYLAIGSRVTDEQLHNFAAKEKIDDVAVLIAFRDGEVTHA